MNLPVIFHRLAIQELRRAVARYAKASLTAPLRFRFAIDRAVERIQTQPETLARMGRIFQWVKTERFPFLLIFRPRVAGGYLVVAVAHTSRRPGYWRGRKEE